MEWTLLHFYYFFNLFIFLALFFFGEEASFSFLYQSIPMVNILLDGGYKMVKIQKLTIS